MPSAGSNESQAGIKIARRNINNLRYADDSTLIAESNEELKRLLMKVKEESEKADLKLNMQKTKIMASDPITSWQIDRETMETVRDFYFLVLLKSLWTVTAAMKLKDTCSLEGKLCQARQHFENQRHQFADKSLYNQSYGFSSSHVQIWELNHEEGWAWKNRCFWIAVLEKTLESPLDSREIKPVNRKSTLNIHWNEWCWSWSSNTLAPDAKRQLTGKDLMLGKIEGRRRRGWQGMRCWMASLTQWTWVWAVKDRGAWHAAVHGVAKSWTWLSNWTTILFFLLQW